MPGMEWAPNLRGQGHCGKSVKVESDSPGFQAQDGGLKTHVIDSDLPYLSNFQFRLLKMGLIVLLRKD